MTGAGGKLQERGGRAFENVTLGNRETTLN